MIFRKYPYKLILTAAVSLLLHSCSTGPETREDADEAEKPDQITELKAKIDNLNNRIFVLTEQVDSLKARLQEERSQQGTASDKALQKKIKPVKAKSAEEEVLAAAVGEDEEQDKETSRAVPSVTTAVAKAVADYEDDPMYREYRSAYKLYQDKEYSKALIAFFAFVEKYPDSFLTDNAYLWLGESYYQQGEYQLAIDEYKKVVQRFPSGSRAPQAMLKISDSYRMLGDKRNSDIYLNSLNSKYPNSRAAEEAVRNRSK